MIYVPCAVVIQEGFVGPFDSRPPRAFLDLCQLDLYHPTALGCMKYEV
jgi:hypothetical protein